MSPHKPTWHSKESQVLPHNSVWTKSGTIIPVTQMLVMCLSYCIWSVCLEIHRMKVFIWIKRKDRERKREAHTKTAFVYEQAKHRPSIMLKKVIIIPQAVLSIDLILLMLFCSHNILAGQFYSLLHIYNDIFKIFL